MLIILTDRPYCPVPDEAGIDELYPGGRESTDFSLPIPDSGWAKWLYRADRLVGIYNKIPVQPWRGLARRKIVNWILEHQEADGAWGGIQPHGYIR